MKEFKLTIKDSSFAFIIGFIFCQLAVLIISIMIVFISSSIGLSLDELESFNNGAVGYLISALSLDIAMLLIFFYYNKDKNNTIFKKPNIRKTLIYTIVAIGSFLALYPLINCIDSLIAHWGIKINTISYELTLANYLISLISLVLLPAICEELLFRGIISRGLKKHGKCFSIFITSLMFSIFHMSISQTIYPFLMSILLTLVMYDEENIFYPILMHAINNFSSLTLSYLGINLVYNHWTYILIAIILATIFISTVIYYCIKGNKESKLEKISNKNLLYLFCSVAIMLFIWIAYNISYALL